MRFCMTLSDVSYYHHYSSKIFHTKFCGKILLHTIFFFFFKSPNVISIHIAGSYRCEITRDRDRVFLNDHPAVRRQRTHKIFSKAQSCFLPRGRSGAPGRALAQVKCWHWPVGEGLPPKRLSMPIRLSQTSLRPETRNLLSLI